MSENASGEATSSTCNADKDSSVECPKCGVEFDSTHGMKIHHKRVHGESIAGELYDCDWCGQTMRIEPNRKDKSKFITCSRECGGRIKSEEYSGENHGSWKGGDVEVECYTCGTPKMVEKHVVERNERHYCDMSCRSNDEGRYAGENHPRWDDSNHITVECKWCGEDFETEVYNNNRFCSVDCVDKWKEVEFAGSGNPYWQGGYTHYYGPSWKDQRDAARERDDYRCQCCSKPESDIDGQHHVHHITPFRKFDDSEKANELSNLVTLCNSCHNRWEGLYLRPDVR